MPAKPAWYSRINEIIEELTALPRPFVDRATLEFLLGVGPRRAQQIMAPCISERLGSSALADREALISHLRRLAEGEDGYYERRRRHRVATILDQLHKERLERPRLLVEAPVRVLSQQLGNLPPGVRLEPGSITLRFDRPPEALEKLLALAMAISNDFASFESLVRASESGKKEPAGQALRNSDS
jgi:hypothetical protein